MDFMPSIVTVQMRNIFQGNKPMSVPPYFEILAIRSHSFCGEKKSQVVRTSLVSRSSDASVRAIYLKTRLRVFHIFFFFFFDTARFIMNVLRPHTSAHVTSSFPKIFPPHADESNTVHAWHDTTRRDHTVVLQR